MPRADTAAHGAGQPFGGSVNFLFHLFLSDDDPEITVGNFMGDFVKGRLGDRFPDGIRAGIELHRRIDSFAQRHPEFSRSRERLDPRYGLYRGVMVDLFYDHFLTAEWGRWESEPLDGWLGRAQALVVSHRSLLPERLQPLVPVIFGELIPSYREVRGIGQALERMARRVSRQNPLPGGEEELTRHYPGLRDDFLRFMPEIREFVRNRLLETRIVARGDGRHESHSTGKDDQ